jgi:hypothetical protein
VRPYVGAPEMGGLDVSPLLRPENLFPFGEHGGFALIWTAPKTREVHTYIVKAGRGRWAVQARSEMIKLARENGTERLWTKIPPQAPHVEMFARGGGMEPTGETADSLGVPHVVFAMELN